MRVNPARASVLVTLSSIALAFAREYSFLEFLFLLFWNLISDSIFKEIRVGYLILHYHPSTAKRKTCAKVLEGVIVILPPDVDGQVCSSSLLTPFKPYVAKR